MPPEIVLEASARTAEAEVLPSSSASGARLVNLVVAEPVALADSFVVLGPAAVWRAVGGGTLSAERVRRRPALTARSGPVSRAVAPRT